MVADKKWTIYLMLAILVGIGLIFQLAAFSAPTSSNAARISYSFGMKTASSDNEPSSTVLRWLQNILKTNNDITAFLSKGRDKVFFDTRKLPLQYPATEFANTIELEELAKRYKEKWPNQTLTILLWTNLFKRTDWALGAELGQAPFKKLQCPVSNCYVTRDRTLLSNASAVLINFRDDFNYKDRPALRPSNQHWIFFLWESPEHTYDWTWQGSRSAPKHLLGFKDFFNWTMTYRLDSDIPFLYGRFTKRQRPEPDAAAINRLATKKKNVIWIQSNCNTRSHRTEFVQELQRYIDVEVIGGCGKAPSSPLSQGICKRVNIFAPMTQECADYISSTYRYYLATENSLCHDYITEKFFRGASLDLIPIVFNGANMSVFGPPRSYIDAKHYDSPEKLAQYLKQVADDENHYNSYFWWKQFYMAQNFWDNDAFARTFCDLCAKMTRAHLEPAKYVKVYSDINDWWMTQGNCYEGKTKF